MAYVEGAVTKSEMRLVRTGMLVRVVSLLRDKTISGALGTVTHSLDSATNSFKVKLQETKDTVSIPASNIHIIILKSNSHKADKRLSITNRRSHRSCGACGRAIDLSLNGISAGKNMDFVEWPICNHEFHSSCLIPMVDT